VEKAASMPGFSRLTGKTSRPGSRQTPNRRGGWFALLAIASILVLVAIVWLAASYDPLRRASLAYSSGDYRAALHGAQERLKHSPSDEPAALLAARCLSKLGHARQAEEYYRRAGSLARGFDDLHDRAYAMARAGQHEQATALYHDILERRPEDALALKRLAAVQMSVKDWKPVLAIAQRLLVLPGCEVAGQTLAGIGHHELKQYAEAIGAGERVLQLDPELREMPLPTTLFWNNLALDLMAVGRSADARAHLARAVEKTQDANLMELLGLTYFQDGIVDQAERCWKQAVLWDPRHADALLGLGRLALNRNQPAEAVEWLSRAADCSPEALEPVYNLTRAYRLLGRTEEAERLERRAESVRASRAGSGGREPTPAQQAEQPARGRRVGATR
jgi:tetratricopeptide (TPR) repeat protein